VAGDVDEQNARIGRFVHGAPLSLTGATKAAILDNL
jgi:hypothetical protein